MLSFLKNHPFAVEAFFESSLVLTFAVRKEELESLIPDCLVLDTFKDKWAFLAVAMVQTSELRPKGFSKLLGKYFFLVGYRVFVKYTNNAGKRLRGLYILKSETDKNEMEFLGNIFTHYHYSTTDIKRTERAGKTEIRSLKSDFFIELNTEDVPVSLPQDSPFMDWQEARKFAGPLPFTFSYNTLKKQVVIIEGVRQHWKPKPVAVCKHNFSYLRQLNISPRLANAFVIQNIPYYWKKGKVERWNT